MLEVADLQKTFGEKTALNKLNMHVPSGEIYGLIGQNGAGKTTFMQILMGLQKADAGRIQMFGYNILENTRIVRDSVGYLPDTFGIYEKVKVLEYLEFFNALYGVKYSAKKYLMELLDLVNLTDKADCYVSTLSKAMKQQLGIARCLVHNPVLLILDEPLSDLDPVGKAEIIEILHHLKQESKTILLSSNVLTELEYTCTQVGIIKNGSVEIEGTIKEVLEKIKESSPIVMTVLGDTSRAMPILRENRNVTRVSIAENTFHIGFKGTEEQEATLLHSLVSGGVQVLTFNRVKGSLENMFFEITEETERKKGRYENQSSLFKRFKIKR